MQLHRIVVVLIRLYVLSYSHHRAWRPRQLPAQYVKLHDIESGRLITHLDHISLQVRESVGDSLREINFIFVFIKVVDETQSEIVFKAFAQIGVVIEKHVVRKGLVGGRLLLLGWLGR
jgi:hypothetical protein